MSSDKYTYTLSSEELKQGAFYFKIHDDLRYIKIGATTIGQLKKAGIIPKKQYKNLLQNKPDGLIISGKNTIKAIIEYKKDDVFNSKEDALNEFKSKTWYSQFAKSVDCNVLCATDGNNTYWFLGDGKTSIKNEDGTDLTTTLDVSKITNNNATKEENKKLFNLIDKIQSLDKEDKIIEKQTLDPQDLAGRVWQKIWINTGKEPEKCLYNVVEIFIFKFLSDLNILKGSWAFNSVFGSEESDGPLKKYACTTREEIKKMFPNGEDGTTVINGTIFVNEKGKPNLSNSQLFNEVLKDFKDFENKHGSFEKIDKNFKTRLYENFLRRQAGIRSLGQYFTPRNVVKSIIEMINPDGLSSDAKICDPFCGVGGFLLELINSSDKIKTQYEPKNGIINQSVEIIGYDKGSDEKEDERTIILAKANMLIYFADLIAKHTDLMAEFSNKVFNKTFHLEKSNIGTFGITKHENYFDLIITNPPYVTSGVSSIKASLDMTMYPSNGGGVRRISFGVDNKSLKTKRKGFCGCA